MGFLSKTYLCTYNAVQVFGWCIILYTLLSHYIVGPSEPTLWEKIHYSLVLFQAAAVFEVLHSMIGLVRANAAITAVQVASRVAVCGILFSVPPDHITSSVALTLTILAWSITEIIRYSYYFTSLIGYAPYPLIWLRYSTFITLYPIGITGELLCYYIALTYSRSHPEVWTYSLPNKWNFTFSYCYFLISIMLTYIPGFPKLYLHMFTQRNKVLGSLTKPKKVQ